MATGSSTHNLTFSYDIFGNMTCVTNAQTQGLCPSYTFNTATNRMSNTGYTYDAAGDLTADGTGTGTHTYQYDAEQRLISVDSGTTGSYTYNALGQRVGKSAGGSYTEYLYDTSGEPVGENNRTSWSTSVVRFGGRHLAHYQNNATCFTHVNKVGSTTQATDNTGAVVQDQIFYPWGQGWAGTGAAVETRFASLQHRNSTSEASLDPTPFRMMSSNQGRWMSPDPLKGNIRNPQSLNRYAYVVNNPTSHIDPTGLFVMYDTPPGPIIGGGGAGGGAVAGKDIFDAIAGAAGTYLTTNRDGTLGFGFDPGSAALSPSDLKFSGTLYGQKYNEKFTTWDQYADWRNGIAALPINQINAAYRLGCQYGDRPCGSNDSVSARYVGSTYNVTLNGNPLNQTAAAQAGYQDPTGFFHNGETSYYIGFGGLFGANAGHVVATPQGVEAHYDDFGGFNPLHWPGALLSLFINTREQAGAGTPYTCSVVGGCQP